MDVKDVEEWVVWMKPEAFYAQSMVFEEDRIVGVGLEEDPSSLWEVTENTIERKIGGCIGEIGSKMVIIAFWKADGAFLNQTALLSIGKDDLEFSMGGGTIGLDESLLYTADIEYGWGDACDKKEMHGCPWIKKASVVKTFT
ncbi:hypothetical protein Tco_0472732 [Tanacetum coccineum]